MKFYCTECFTKNEYKFSKPKFCPECGAPVGLSLSRDVRSTTASKDSADGGSLEKIKNLEKEIEKLKSAKTSNIVGGNTKAFEQHNDMEEEFEEDYHSIQKHINNFRRNNNRSGVTVEGYAKNSGISFGELVQSSSSTSVDEFKIHEDRFSGPMKSKEQILNELKMEASSAAKLIEIE